MAASLTDEWIKQQLKLCESDVGTRPKFGALPDSWHLSVHPVFIAAACEGYPLVLKKLQALRQRRCTNCEFYAYYDGPLCGFSVDTDESFLWHHDPDTWYCADWKSREEAADASTTERRVD